MASEKEEERQFGSARVPESGYTAFRAFLKKKTRGYSWFIRGILLFPEEKWEELYNQIEETYAETYS